MTKRLSPHAIVALKDALCEVYWYKADLRSFLQQCLSNSAILSTLNWGNYKRQIVSDLVDYLIRNQDKHLDDLTCLCQEVCNISSFRHLEQLEDGIQKADRARKAIAQLKQLLKPHLQVKKEQEDLIERQKKQQKNLKQIQLLDRNLKKSRKDTCHW